MFKFNSLTPQLCSENFSSRPASCLEEAVRTKHKSALREMDIIKRNTKHNLAKINIKHNLANAVRLCFMLEKNSTVLSSNLVRLTGIEPVHPAPEAGALSPELQALRCLPGGLLYYYIRTGTNCKGGHVNIFC